MRRKNTHSAGFTLVEILISLSILVVGIVGILTLFPVGLNSTKLAIEDTYSAMVADSSYASLRASAKQMTPGDQLIYFHDGIDDSANKFTLPARGQSIGIPAPITATGSGNYVGQMTTLPPGGQIPNYDDAFFCQLGQNQGNFDAAIGNDDRGQLGQYSFNIELAYPEKISGKDTPRGLFDVIIRVRRGKRLLKKFYSKIALPTNVD